MEWGWGMMNSCSRFGSDLVQKRPEALHRNCADPEDGRDRFGAVHQGGRGRGRKSAPVHNPQPVHAGTVGQRRRHLVRLHGRLSTGRVRAGRDKRVGPDIGKIPDEGVWTDPNRHPALLVADPWRKTTFRIPQYERQGPRPEVLSQLSSCRRPRQRPSAGFRNEDQKGTTGLSSLHLTEPANHLRRGGAPQSVDRLRRIGQEPAGLQVRADIPNPRAPDPTNPGRVRWPHLVGPFPTSESSADTESAEASVRRPRRNSATGISSGCVTLKFHGLPSTIRTAPPAWA